MEAAMNDDTENMVLRTLYLPRDLDQKLKSAANRGARSKGDVIRELILAGLEQKSAERGSYFAEPSSAKKPVQPSAPTRALVTKAKPHMVKSRKQAAVA
jgi:hypothetical protein